MNYTAKRYQSNLHKYMFELEKSNEEFNLLFTSDWHIDNPKTNREMLFNHLDEALQRNAYIVINGDLMCLMQGKYDPRGSKSSILPEHNGNNYLDLVINSTADMLVPYAHNILQINQGNHETSVSKRNETDVLQRLVERINTLAGSNIQLGAYTGYISVNLSRRGGENKTFKIGYSHGNWGGVVTKGVLGVGRMASMMPDADIIISGHTHDSWIMQFNQLSANFHKGKIENKKQYHIKTGTYKEEFTQGEGWAVERIGMPKSLGSVFGKVFYKRGQDLDFEFTQTRDFY